MKLHSNAQTCPHCRFLIVKRVLEGRGPKSVADDFEVDVKTVSKWLRRYRRDGLDGLKDRSSRPHKIVRRHLQPGKELNDVVFSLLHAPPSACGFNRTTWRLSDLKVALTAKGVSASQTSISAAIKQAGYSWKKARVALTSNDPQYREKVDAIRAALTTLEDDEAFFSIDEFGPLAVKMRGGRSLQLPGKVRSIPQWQRSKGSLIVTAALDLSRNQVFHFFSDKKNTVETCKLVELLRNQYKGYRRMYLSWDAAPWHSSQELADRIEFLNEWGAHDVAPQIEILPLPASAQFLNVIESVFSGMARAIIHNSDYASVEQAQAAISRYMHERNMSFAAAPRQAGHAIWGKERSPSSFLETNNCKDARYR
jgi:transposase